MQVFWLLAQMLSVFFWFFLQRGSYALTSESSSSRTFLKIEPLALQLMIVALLMLVISMKKGVVSQAVSSDFLFELWALWSYVICTFYKILYETKAINAFFLRKNVTSPPCRLHAKFRGCPRIDNSLRNVGRQNLFHEFCGPAPVLTVYFGTPNMFITLWFGFVYGTNPPLGTLII
jgi:hypothetical protein